MTPLELTIYTGLAWVACISLVVVIIVYGLLTPWWRSRTGIGFMSTKVAFLVAVILTLFGLNGYRVPVWIAYAAWILMILAINLGITWNIVYKQFVQHRGDEVADKSTDHLVQAGVSHDAITGSIPIQQGDRDDRGISG